MMNKLFFFLIHNCFPNTILIFLKIDGCMINKFGINLRNRIFKNAHVITAKKLNQISA